MLLLVAIVLMFCDSGVTASSRYQTNAVQVHDYNMKTVRPQAYANNTVGYSLGGVALTRRSTVHLACVRSLCKLNMKCEYS